MTMRQLAVAALAALTITACGDDPVSPDNIAGTYQLNTINGQPLPFTLIEDGADRLELIAGTIVLRSNSTFTDSTTLRLTSGTTVETEPTVAAGTYSIDDGIITFTPDDSPPYTVTVSGSTLVQREQGLVLEYRR